MEQKTKERILALLEENRGEHVSGSWLGDSLGISRSAVWKAIKLLREEGHQIKALTNLGYSLSEESDLLSAEGIWFHLNHKELSRENIVIYKQTGSTNQDAKSAALAGAAHGTAILAEEQTAGRGRLGRSFHSPKGTGLYLSLVLRPSGTLEAAVPITQAAAVAVCRALEQTLSINASIKWVNDIFVDGKKVCGILTEAVSDFETGHIEALILGIGLNVAEPPGGFPTDLSNIAGALHVSGTDCVSRNKLAAAIIDEVLDLVEDLEGLTFLDEYRARCFILGRDVTVSRGFDSYDAIPSHIDNKGGLVVKKADGSFETLTSGEITIRPKEEIK